MLCGTIAAAQAPKDLGQDVTILQLIASPGRYHGRVVFLSAFATVKFENMSLCMVRDSASSKDCLWLQFYDGPYETAADNVRYMAARKQWEKFHGKKISLRGTFNMENTGHFGMWSGAIEHITEVHLR